MARWSLFPLLVLSCLGCAEPTTGTVSGTILIDGEVAESGSIAFTATDGKTGPAGTKFTDGKYSVELPLGEASVAIRVPKVVGEKKLYENDPNSPVQTLTAEALPRRYNDETELLYTVIAGESTQDFELSTKKKKKK